MRIVERSPDQRSLNLLFLPQEPRRVMPDEIAEEIVLTHPAQPPTATFFERLQRDQAVGGSAVTTVDLPGAPADRYFYVMACGAFHNDTTVRNMRLLIGSSALGYSEIAASAVVQGNQQPLAVGRAFLVPPGLNIRFTVDALSAPFVLTVRATFVEYLLAENHPNI